MRTARRAIRLVFAVAFAVGCQALDPVGTNDGSRSTREDPALPRALQSLSDCVHRRARRCFESCDGCSWC